MMAVRTKIWPTLEEWKDTILFIETSKDKPSPDFIKWTFRKLAAQGILKGIKGITPYGINAELNCENKTIVLLECPTA